MADENTPTTPTPTDIGKREGGEPAAGDTLSQLNQPQTVTITGSDGQQTSTTLEDVVREHGFGNGEGARCFSRNEQNQQCLLVAGHGTGRNGDAVPHVYKGVSGDFEARL